MKKLAILILIVIMCTGCFLTKWSFKINDDYHIEHESVDDIYLYKNDTKVLDKYISNYAVLEEHYIYLETLRNYNDSVIILYYIVDMDNDKLDGPFTASTVMDALADRGLIPGDLIDTTKRS